MSTLSLDPTAFDLAGESWTARVHDDHRTFRFDGVRSPAGAVILPPPHLSAGSVGALVRGMDARGWGAAVITLSEPAPAEALQALQAHGFVERERWVEVQRDLAALPAPGEHPFALRPFFDDLERAVPLLAELARGLALLGEARPEDVLAHFVALSGGDTSAWTIAYHDDRPAGLFLPAPPDEGTLWLLGVAPWARGRGWGACLHRLALAALQERGASRYRDATPAGQQAMRRIFQRHGCAEVGRFVELVRERPARPQPSPAARPSPPGDPLSAAATARALARVIFAALLDHPAQDGSPLIVLDIRPGTGVRAARVLAQLDALLSSHPRVLRPFLYVLCTRGDPDGAPWSEVEALGRWLRAGQLDYASFDPRTDDALLLEGSGRRIVPDGAVPVLAIACEVFCALPQDAWRLEPSGPRPLRDGEGPAPSSPEAQELPEIYDEIGMSLVFWSYASKLSGCDVLLPVGALAWLEAMATWARGRLVVLSMDPGTRTLSELSGRRLSSPQAAGALPVDHAALAMAVSAAGGLVLLGPGGDGETVVAASVYGEPASVALTLLAWRQAFLEACPLLRNLPRPAAPAEGGLAELLARLTLAADDPELFLELADALRARLAEASTAERQAVYATVRRVERQVSWRPEAPDVHFALGQVLHALRLPAEADAALLASERQYGATVASRMNRGLCRWAMGDRAEAERLFQEVLARSPGEPAALACLAALRQPDPDAQP